MQNAPQDSHLIDAIKKCKLFSKLSDTDIFTILPNFEKIALHAGDILFLQGNVSDALYILLAGKLTSVVITHEDITKVLGTIQPGETVGELGALSGEPRSLTVKAMIDSELLKLPSEIFKTICQNFPIILSEISKVVIDRSITTIKWITDKKIIKLGILYAPIQDPILKETVKYHLQKHFTSNQKAKLIFSENIEMNQLIILLEQAEKNYSSIFIYMDVWKPDILQAYFEKLTTFYFMSFADEINLLSDSMINLMKGLHSDVRTELILLHPDNTQQPSDTKKWLDKFNFTLHHHVRLTNASDYQRVIRFMTGNAFTLVLGGGGSKGLAHLGVIKAIIENGLTIDAIGGASIGASIGGSFAYTQDLERCILLFNKLKKATISSLKFRGLTWPIISFFSGTAATKELKKNFGSFCVEDLWIPYFALSACLTEKKEIIFDKGFMWEALRASSSLPGIFPPVVHDGKLYLDGGLLNNLPVDVMRSKIGSDNKILAVSLYKMNALHKLYDFPPMVSFSEAILFKLGLSFKKYVYPPFFETFLNSLLLGASEKEKRNVKKADLLVYLVVHPQKFLHVTQAEEMEMMSVGSLETKSVIENFLISHPDYKRHF